MPPSKKVTCRQCKKTLKCKYPSCFQRHLMLCKGLKNKCNQSSPINNNNISNGGDMSISGTSDTNNSIDKYLNTTTIPFSENNNDYYPPDIEVGSVIDDDMLYDDIMETCDPCFNEVSSEYDISLESIDALE